MDRSYGHTQCRCWLYCWWAAGTDFGPRRLTDSPYDAGHHAVRLIYPAGRDTAVKTNHIVALRPQKRRLIRNGEPRTATSTFTRSSWAGSDHWAGHVQPGPRPPVTVAVYAVIPGCCNGQDLTVQKQKLSQGKSSTMQREKRPLIR